MNPKSLDLSKLATKLVTNKWSLAPLHHSHLCKMVDAYMRGDISYTPKMQADDAPVVLPTSPDFPVAVIGVSGVLSKGVSEIEEVLLGMTDIDALTEALTEAANDETVKQIYLGFSSPGGECTGIEEAGRLIQYIDKNIKPVYGWTESSSNSAAYWLMANCRKIGMSPSATVGSCGVYSLVANSVEAMRMQGVAIEAFSSGKWKMMGHDFRTLTDAERELLQTDVEKQHEKFKAVIQSNRPQVSSEVLEGLSYEGPEAKNHFLVDMVCDSFNEFLAATVE